MTIEQSWGQRLLALALLASGAARRVGAAGCPPGFSVPAGKECHVVTFAGAHHHKADDPSQQLFLDGLSVFMDHANAHGGLRLGDGVGYVNVSYVALDYTKIWQLSAHYGALCVDPAVTVLIAPFASAATPDILELVWGVCPKKVILAAGGADRDYDYSKPQKRVWSPFTPSAQWGGQGLVSYLHGLGASSAYIVDSAESEGIGDDLKKMLDESLGPDKWDRKRLVDAKPTEADLRAAADYDVLVVIGDDSGFTAAAAGLEDACLAPKAAVFIEEHGDGIPSAGELAGHGPWIGTVPWSVEMDYPGPVSLSSSEQERYLGSAQHFGEIVEQHCNISTVSYYHAEAAATMLMFQMGVEQARFGAGLSFNELTNNQGQNLRNELASLDVATFWGRLNMSAKGWNTAFKMGLEQIQGGKRVLLAATNMSNDTLAEDTAWYPATDRWPHMQSDPCRPWSWDRWSIWHTVGAAVLGALVAAAAAVCVWRKSRCCRKARWRYPKEAESTELTQSLVGGIDKMPDRVLVQQDVPARWNSAEVERQARGRSQPPQSPAGSPLARNRSAPALQRHTSPILDNTWPRTPKKRIRKDEEGSVHIPLPIMFVDQHVPELQPERWREQELGKGSFGKVYRATWRGLEVAVKEMKLAKIPRGRGGLEDTTAAVAAAKRKVRAASDDFVREVEVCCDLAHPNLVRLLGYATTPRLLIVQELMAGKALDKQLYVEKWVPTTAQVIKVATDVAVGMEYLHTAFLDLDSHSKPVIHRDLKSPNLLLEASPPRRQVGDQSTDISGICIKIADFGLSRDKELDEEKETLIMTGCGSMLWMAPELLSGSKYNEKVDVFAFAMCLLECIDCSLPWHGGGEKWRPHQIPVIVAQGRRPVAQLRAAEFPLQSLIKRCWHQQPQDRPDFQTIAAELRDMRRTLVEDSRNGSPSRLINQSLRFSGSGGDDGRQTLGSDAAVSSRDEPEPEPMPSAAVSRPASRSNSLSG